MARGVVVTGLGAVSPMGLGVRTLWEGIMEGRPAIHRIQAFDASELSVQIAAEVPAYEPEAHFSRKDLRKLDRYMQFALLAAGEAIEQARLHEIRDRARVGVSLGTGIGGLETFCEQHEILREQGARRLSPFFIPRLIPNLGTGHVAIRHDLRGPSGTSSTACCSGAHAIVEGVRAILLDEADAMVVGGAEAAIQPLGIAGFAAMRALSSRNDAPEAASRPFDVDRDGFVMGEGAGVLVLESEASARARGAPVLGRILGYGLSTDAHDIAAPCPDGRGAVQAMQAALRSASLEPDRIGYINAHGTSTQQNDAIESQAIAAVFGEAAPPTSSTKSMIGHLLGAAGAVEAVLCLLALRHHLAPPTINLERLDPACAALDYVPGKSRALSASHALSNSFAFGGLNVCLVLGPA